MYSVVLTNGKIININADDVAWLDKTRMFWFTNGGRVVAKINADNVVGWINADYKVESEE